MRLMDSSLWARIDYGRIEDVPLTTEFDVSAFRVARPSRIFSIWHIKAERWGTALGKTMIMLPLQQFPIPRPVSGWQMKARLSLRSWWSGSIFRMLLRSCESWRNMDWKTSRNTLGCPLPGIRATDGSWKADERQLLFAVQ